MVLVRPTLYRTLLIRKVNSFTEKDAYPLPQISGILSRLPKAEYITSLDLKDAYWQVPLDKTSRDKTAFTVPGRPLYQLKLMPFGLCNATSTMSRLMDKVVPAHLRNEVFIYLDERHLEVLREVALQIRRAARWALALQRYDFAIEHRKGSMNVVPDSLSRVNEDAVAAIDLREGLLVDLNSDHFKVSANQKNFPDLRTDSGYIYLKAEHLTGEQVHDEYAWKLWVPKELVSEILSRAHDNSLSAHGGIHKTIESVTERVSTEATRRRTDSQCHRAVWKTLIFHRDSTSGSSPASRVCVLSRGAPWEGQDGPLGEQQQKQ
ncbi:uncharacterized protein LOC122319465 [Drosophila yakuba]|uniref:uncharacterized protein LOC122319465 n=1 Tax=Drosophila yakuba TaxID=7245 RepID=UPI001C8AA0D0|nr:uncharacterized protein LOC122319465 [Drosophila yakuba]